MPKEQSYSCQNCGREVGKLNLLAKRVEFREVGKGGLAVKSRTIGWLCTIPQEDGSPSCIDKDQHWNLPAWATSPGMEGTALQEAVAPLSDPLDVPFSREDMENLDEYLRETGLR